MTGVPVGEGASLVSEDSERVAGLRQTRSYLYKADPELAALVDSILGIMSSGAGTFIEAP